MKRALIVVVLLLVSVVPAGARATAATWYVSAAAAPSGDGSARAPFASLAAVERASAPGDTIVVLRAAKALDGGIALKPRQRLIGSGPRVIGSTAAKLPRLTNTTARLAGDAVRLADRAEVKNLVIRNTRRGGIYGLDVTGVNVRGNDISAHNTSCTIGFEVHPLVAPSNTPFVGVPFGAEVPGVGYAYVIYIPNGWAGIMVDATRAVGRVTIERNLVHDATCGDGIDLRLRRTADLTARIANNRVTRLKQGHFENSHPVSADSLMAIGLQTEDASRLTVDEIRNTETYIGGPDSDCEGLFFDVSGHSTMNARVDGNTFAHGIGGTSCNGMELISGLDPSTADVRVRNSTFEDNPGDMIEAGTVGNSSTMYLSLDHVTVRNTTIRGGNSGPIPFNVGECLIAGNSGAEGVFSLRIRHSEFSGCNNGVLVASNVALGNGPGVFAESLSVDIADTRIHDNAFYNLWIQNGTPLRLLSVTVARTDLSRAAGTGFAVDAKPTGVALLSAIDVTQSCLFGSKNQDAETTGFHVVARNNWWGARSGPEPGKTSASPPGLASLDTGAPLAAPAAICL